MEAAKIAAAAAGAEVMSKAFAGEARSENKGDTGQSVAKGRRTKGGPSSGLNQQGTATCSCVSSPIAATVCHFRPGGAPFASMPAPPMLVCALRSPKPCM